MSDHRAAIRGLDPARPVLIAGPTASGKSALALEIAATSGGVIVNADALQVYARWRVLTARPDAADLARARHALYGHIDAQTPYSVGAWLRDLAPLLADPAPGARPIIVGGTGLYFSALTEGLAEIPAIPAEVRAQGDALRARDPQAMIADLVARDPASAASVDLVNPMRVQRAWEVLQATGRGLAAWQADTPAPLLPLAKAQAFVIDCPPAVLGPRIAARFDRMLNEGALDEVRAALHGWDPALPSSRAIGAPELVAYLQGQISLETARDRAIIATRQYAKRQRTWFRNRLSVWQSLPVPDSMP